MTKDGEIVELKGTSNGRSCVSHDCSAEHVNLDDLVHFRLSVAVMAKLRRQYKLFEFVVALSHVQLVSSQETL